MASIFISYSRESKPIAMTLAADIVALGHTVWFDQEISGGRAWWDEILAKVRGCDVFVFVLNPETLASAACKSEYSYAADLGKSILPILVSEQVSTNLLPPAQPVIGSVNYELEGIGLTGRRAFITPRSAVRSRPPLPNKIIYFQRTDVQGTLPRGLAWLFDWRRSDGWWHRFPVDSVRLHQFDASAVGIEKVRLTLAILANLYFDRSVVVLARRTRFENGDGLLNIRSDQTNVIPHSHLLCVRTLVVKHELEILVLVNLDESDAIGAVLAFQHVWFLVSKKVFIKRSGLR